MPYPLHHLYYLQEQSVMCKWGSAVADGPFNAGVVNEGGRSMWQTCNGQTSYIICEGRCAVAIKVEKLVTFRIWDHVPEGITLIFCRYPNSLIRQRGISVRQGSLCAEEQLDPFSNFDTILACDRRLDRHQAIAYTVLASVSYTHLTLPTNREV